MATCVVCKRGDLQFIKLECSNEHSICAECLKTNVKKYGPDNMYTCSQCNPGNIREKVWVFVDGSNVWIGAKNLSANQKGFVDRRISDDWLLRISWRQLIDLVVSGRDKAEHPKVYVSYGREESTKILLKALKNMEWLEVIEKEKDPISGKEKEIDCQITADITALACKTPEVDRSTIILIGGDRDFKPAIEKALEQGKWRVEVYMWGHASSTELTRISNCQWKYLDTHLDTVSFTYHWIRGNWPPGSQVSLQTRPGARVTIENESEEWWKALESISKWPIQGQWQGDEGDVFVLVFPTNIEGRQFPAQEFIRELNEKLQTIPILERTINNVLNLP